MSRHKRTHKRRNAKVLTDIELQRMRRDAAIARGDCRICCVRPASEGLNRLLAPYRTCEKCRFRTEAGKARQRLRDRNRIRRPDPITGKWITVGHHTPVVPISIDVFCVDCSAHGFHRAGCAVADRRVA